MPFYVYKCARCGVLLERLAKLTDAPPACVPCKQPMEKQVAAPGFVLTGVGVYKNGTH